MEIQTKHELIKRKERKARLAQAAAEAWKIGMTLEEYDKHLEQKAKLKPRKEAGIERAESAGSSMSQGSIPVNHAPSLKHKRDLEDVKEELCQGK